MKEPMRQDEASWQKGYDAGKRAKVMGRSGRVPTAPHGVDAWSWYAGFIEGFAAEPEKVRP